jgi:hypothetical protein
MDDVMMRRFSVRQCDEVVALRATE